LRCCRLLSRGGWRRASTRLFLSGKLEPVTDISSECNAWTRISLHVPSTPVLQVTNVNPLSITLTPKPDNVFTPNHEIVFVAPIAVVEPDQSLFL
jgi:hypothetical protein